MQICTVVKLHTTPAQHSALVQTMRQCNAACNQISAAAFDDQTFRKYDLHHLTYHPMRTQTKLAAGHVVCAIAKVATSYELDRDTPRTFRPLGAIELNKDTLTWKVQEQIVTINTVGGRIKLIFTCGADQKALLGGKWGQSDLLLRDGVFYLSCAVAVPEAESFLPEGVIGVDLGIVNVATDSEGNRYTGEAIKQVRRKYRALRQSAQAKQTRSARKRLAKNRRKESRFVRDVNHRVANTLVRLAFARKKTLAIERLKDIRERGNRLNRAMRRELNNWAFAQLKAFLTYKCRRVGVPLAIPDARYSSQQCSQCGHTERANRPSQEVFRCRHCCFQANADVNAAKVLETRVTLSTGPMFHISAHAAKWGDKLMPLGVSS